MSNQKEPLDSEIAPLKQEKQMEKRVGLNEKIQTALSNMQSLLNITQNIQAKIAETISFAVDLANCSLDVRESASDHMSESNRVLIDAVKSGEGISQSGIKALTKDGYSREEVKALLNYFGFKKENDHRTDPNLQELGEKMRTGANHSFQGIQKEIDRVDYSLFASEETQQAFDEKKSDAVVAFFKRFMMASFKSVRTNLATGASAETLLLERGAQDEKLLEFINTIENIREKMGSKIDGLKEKESSLIHTIKVVSKNIDDPDKIRAIVDLLETGGSIQELYQEAIQIEEVDIGDVDGHSNKEIDFTAELKKKQAALRVKKLEKKLAGIQEEKLALKLKAQEKKQIKKQNATLVKELESQSEEAINIGENDDKKEYLDHNAREEYQKALKQNKANHIARKISFWHKLSKWLNSPWDVKWKQLGNSSEKKNKKKL